ncbi:hypothetical protein FM107_10320 [Sphingobacterium sp. JB170]|nr:hypothetical protein FM107_10320 [Sphingobacterium sp. JB170]
MHVYAVFEIISIQTADYWRIMAEISSFVYIKLVKTCK